MTLITALVNFLTVPLRPETTVLRELLSRRLQSVHREVCRRQCRRLPPVRVLWALVLPPLRCRCLPSLLPRYPIPKLRSRPLTVPRRLVARLVTRSACLRRTRASRLTVLPQVRLACRPLLPLEVHKSPRLDRRRLHSLPLVLTRRRTRLCRRPTPTLPTRPRHRVVLRSPLLMTRTECRRRLTRRYLTLEPNRPLARRALLRFLRQNLPRAVRPRLQSPPLALSLDPTSPPTLLLAGEAFFLEGPRPLGATIILLNRPVGPGALPPRNGPNPLPIVRILPVSLPIILIQLPIRLITPGTRLRFYPLPLRPS